MNRWGSGGLLTKGRGTLCMPAVSLALPSDLASDLHLRKGFGLVMYMVVVVVPWLGNDEA